MYHRSFGLQTLDSNVWRWELPTGEPAAKLAGHTYRGSESSCGSSKKQRCRSKPAHNWTPIMPKMKKTKKHNKSTLESIGRVSASSETSSRRPVGRESGWGRGRERKRTRIRKSKRLNVGIQWNAKRSRKRLNFNMEVAFIAPTRFWLRTLKRVREDSFKVFVWKRIVSMGATRMQLHFGKLTAYSL